MNDPPDRTESLFAAAANARAQQRLKQIEKANDLLGSIFENLDPRKSRATNGRCRRSWSSSWARP